jgi:hypothetical protein
MSELPININEKMIMRLKEYVNELFQIHDASGNVDLQKTQYSLSYLIGEKQTEINGLLMQEKQKLCDIESSLKTLRARTYHNLKSNRIPYDINEQGYITLVDGSEEVVKKENEMKKQKVYVEFLESTLSQIRYFTNGAKQLIDIEKIKLGIF